MNSRSQSAPATTVSTCQCQSTGAKGPHLETESLVMLFGSAVLKESLLKKNCHMLTYITLNSLTANADSVQVPSNLEGRKLRNFQSSWFTQFPWLL